MINAEIKEIIKESVREVLREERLTLYEILIPTVSKKELVDIHQRYGSPQNYRDEDFVDMTSWIKE